MASSPPAAVASRVRSGASVMLARCPHRTKCAIATGLCAFMAPLLVRAPTHALSSVSVNDRSSTRWSASRAAARRGSSTSAISLQMATSPIASASSVDDLHNIYVQLGASQLTNALLWASRYTAPRGDDDSCSCIICRSTSKPVAVWPFSSGSPSAATSALEMSTISFQII